MSRRMKYSYWQYTKSKRSWRCLLRVQHIWYVPVIDFKVSDHSRKRICQQRLSTGCEVQQNDVKTMNWGVAVWHWTVLDMYWGVWWWMDLKTRTRILKSMRCLLTCIKHELPLEDVHFKLGKTKEIEGGKKGETEKKRERNYMGGEKSRQEHEGLSFIHTFFIALLTPISWIFNNWTDG